MTTARGLLAISLLVGKVEGDAVGSRKELRGSMVEHRGARGSSEEAVREQGRAITWRSWTS